MNVSVENSRRFQWRDASGEHEVNFVWVPGTQGTPFSFGHDRERRSIEVSGCFISTTPVTQALWQLIMGVNPSVHREPECPVENVSYTQITAPDGFLARLNASDVLAEVAPDAPALHFRLPSEAEWEYAARGGPSWPDNFAFSGSNEPNSVAWYGPRWNRVDAALVRMFGWPAAWKLTNRVRKMLPHRTRTHPVATKTPNQLGIYDMSGNVWEWCEDACVEDIEAVPSDGRPYLGSGTERRLRGGSFANWDLHCRVWWRYGIEPSAHDGCIGLRLVLAESRKP